MLPAAVGQAEMVEPVRKGLAGEGDVELVGDGEIGQALSPGGVPLREEHFLVGTVQGAPVGDPALQGAPHAVRHDVRSELLLQGLEDADRHQAGRPVQHL